MLLNSRLGPTAMATFQGLSIIGKAFAQPMAEYPKRSRSLTT